MFHCFYLQNLVLFNMHGITIHVSMVHSLLASTISFVVTVRVATYYTDEPHSTSSNQRVMSIVCEQLLKNIHCCCRRAARKGPGSAGVINMAGTASRGADVTAQCVALSPAHWSEHHHHRHTVQHPHVKPDLMSSMHFSRPRSALHTSVHHQVHTAAESDISNPGNMEEHGSHAEAASTQCRSSAAAQQTAGGLGQVRALAGDDGARAKMRSCASSAAVAAACGMQGYTEPDHQESLVAPESLLQDAQSTQVVPCEDCTAESSKGELGEALESRQQSGEVAADQRQPGGINCGVCSKDAISRRQAGRLEPEEEPSSERQASGRHRKSERQERQRDRFKGRQQCSQPEDVCYGAARVYRLRPGVMHLPTAQVRPVSLM